ncbi:MAG: acyl-CoA dehydrogenase family protein [Myxococcota bacterium]
MAIVFSFPEELEFMRHKVRDFIGRAFQVHGAPGYSTDTPLTEMATLARWARFAAGADEVRQWRIAMRMVEAHRCDGTNHKATGDVPL